MRVKFGGSALVGLLFLVACSLISAGPAQAAWSPAVSAFEQTVTTPPTVGIPSTDSVIPKQAVLDDGSSVAAWLQDAPGAGSAELHARVVDRAGTAVGPDVLIRSVPGTVEVGSWEIAPLGDGVIVFWVEGSVLGGVQTQDLQYRTLSSTGVLGAATQLDFGSVPTANGFVEIGNISASSGGGVANVSWSLEDRRGDPASNCGTSFFFSSTTGPCTLVNKVRFARFAGSGTLASPVSDLLAREFTSENTTCPYSQATQTSLLTAPMDGSATALIRDYCGIDGGQADPTLFQSRIPAAGQPTPAKAIQQLPESAIFGSPFVTWSSSMSAEGTAVFSLNGQVLRVAKGGKVSGPVEGVTSLPSGWTAADSGLEMIALPGDRAVALFAARRSDGGNLTRALWSRLIEADGSLGKPKQLYSKTWGGSSTGYSLSTYIGFEAANGLGKATGTVAITVSEYRRISNTSTSISQALLGLGLDGSGARSGEPTLLGSVSTDFSPSTEYTTTDMDTSIEVGRDGTASLMSQTYQTKYLSAAPYTGFSRVALTDYKLVRNPGTCGVTPSLCKANVKVSALKRIGGGAKAKLTITLKNTGNRDASKVKVGLSAKGGARVQKTVTFPKVLEGKTAKKTVKVRGSGTIKVKVGKSSKSIRV